MKKNGHLLLSAIVFFTLARRAYADLKTLKMYKDLPAVISCEKAEPLKNVSKDENVQCIIENKDLKTRDVYDIVWGNLSTEGYTFNATDEWNNTEVEIIVTPKLSNTTIASSQFVVILKKFTPSRESTKFTKKLGDTLIGLCEVPEELKNQMFENQFKKIGATWYKDKDSKIEEVEGKYGLSSASVSEGDLRTMEIINVSILTDPGHYQCTMEYKANNWTVKQFDMCIIEPGETTIHHIQNYYVQPGEDLDVSCEGIWRNPGILEIQWFKKNGKEWPSLCSNDNQDCTYIEDGYVSLTFCEKKSEKEVLEARKNNGRFFATHKLKNVTENATYACKASYPGSRTFAKFNVTVKDMHGDPKELKIVLAISAGCIALALLIGFLLYRKKMEIKYFEKKFFRGYLETDCPVTYFVYTDHGSNGNQRASAVHNVTTWLTAQSYKYHNPNDGNSFNDVGAPVVDRTRLVLERSLSMTVFLTFDLLNENTLEIFKTYTGFEDNVERNFPVIFICDKELKKEIYAKAKSEHNSAAEIDPKGGKNENREIYVTFRHFMERNTVIYWPPQNQSKLHRSLYVAFPKVKQQPKGPVEYTAGDYVEMNKYATVA